jgi:hypothetical protein
VADRDGEAPGARRKGRRAAFGVLTALLVVGIVEVLAFATGRLIYGPAFREIESSDPTGAAAGDRVGAGLPTWLAAYRLHPYLGYVVDPAEKEFRAHPDLIDLTPLGFFRFRKDLVDAGTDAFRVGMFGGSVATFFTVMAHDQVRDALAHRSWQRLAAEAPDLARLAEIGRIALYRRWRVCLHEAFSGAIARRSATAMLLWRTGDTQLARWIEAASDAVDARAKHVQVAGDAWAGVVQSHEALVARLIELWFHSSLAMHELCESRGIRYVHVLQPNQYFSHAKPMTADEERIALRKDHPFRRAAELGYPLLREYGQKLVAAGVDFYDLSTVFDGVKEPLYVDDCCHFNKRGNEILADALLRALGAHS